MLRLVQHESRIDSKQGGPKTDLWPDPMLIGLGDQRIIACFEAGSTMSVHDASGALMMHRDYA